MAQFCLVAVGVRTAGGPSEPSGLGDPAAMAPSLSGDGDDDLPVRVPLLDRSERLAGPG